MHVMEMTEFNWLIIFQSSMTNSCVLISYVECRKLFVIYFFGDLYLYTLKQKTKNKVTNLNSHFVFSITFLLGENVWHPLVEMI